MFLNPRLLLYPVVSKVLLTDKKFELCFKTEGKSLGGLKQISMELWGDEWSLPLQVFQAIFIFMPTGDWLTGVLGRSSCLLCDISAFASRLRRIYGMRYTTERRQSAGDIKLHLLHPTWSLSNKWEERFPHFKLKRRPAPSHWQRAEILKGEMHLK